MPLLTPVFPLSLVFSAFSKVLHVKNVMQCAVLEEFSMFLVLADHVSPLFLLSSALRRD